VSHDFRVVKMMMHSQTHPKPLASSFPNSPPPKPLASDERARSSSRVRPRALESRGDDARDRCADADAFKRRAGARHGVVLGDTSRWLNLRREG